MRILGPNIETEIPTDVQQLTPTWAWIRIQREMKKAPGYMPLEGLAPAGDLERRVQAFIDSSEGR